MKYKLTEETIMMVSGCILHRIECVESFNGVNAGDKGGWIENESNLSQEGNCWVYDEAIVGGLARVYDNAIVCDNARVIDCAEVFGNAIVRDTVMVFGNAKIFENACVYNMVNIYGHAKISGNAHIYDSANIFGDAIIFGDALIGRDVVIRGDAIVRSDKDYFIFKNNWSSGRYFTYTKSNKMWAVGCFYGTGSELIERAYDESVDNGKHYEAYVKFVKQLERI